MKKLISLILSAIILCSVGVPVGAVGGETSESAPTPQITLKTKSANIYVANTLQISPVIKNQVGTVKYSSSNKKIATVSDKGVVKGIKKGSATITITNNGASAAFKVKVKDPKLNKTKVTLKPKKTSGYNKTFNLKVTGKAPGSKVSYKSKNTKVATVTQSGKITAKAIGTTTITARYLGKTYKCKVAVKKLTDFDKKVKYSVAFKLKKKSITMNVGEKGVGIGGYYKLNVKSNLDDMFNLPKYPTSQQDYNNYAKYAKYAQQIEKEVGKVKFSVADKSVAKIKKENTGYVIYPVAKGNTTLKITLKDKILKVKVNVTKVKETTYKGKKSKACYNSKDVYNTLKDSWNNYIFKGKEPRYSSVTCYFDSDNILDKVDEYKISDYGVINLGYNCYYGYNFDFTTNNHDVEIIWFAPTKKQLKYYAELYNEANKILTELNIYSYKEDYEKIQVLGDEFFNKEVTYGSAEFPQELYNMCFDSEYSIIINHVGVCADYSEATEYFCFLLNIPCTHYFTEDHGWNIIRVQGKWYHLDILWNLYFLGNKDIVKYESHKAYRGDDYRVVENESLNIK